GLNIRYKEYKGTDTELEWLNNIVEDSADLLGVVKEQFLTEFNNNSDHAIYSLGLYAETCLFRSITMTERKITYHINRDSERNVMLSECTKEFDNIFKKIDPIISD
uniref:hypothetical protein n=1 Tax=Clostridium sp. HBUAS56017 TaxID=2571128 RepID=UPI00163D8F4B